MKKKACNNSGASGRTHYTTFLPSFDRLHVSLKAIAAGLIAEHQMHLNFNPNFGCAGEAWTSSVFLTRDDVTHQNPRIVVTQIICFI